MTVNKKNRGVLIFNVPFLMCTSVASPCSIEYKVLENICISAEISFDVEIVVGQFIKVIEYTRV